MNTVQDIRNQFIDKYKNGEFTIDKTGVKTVEIIGENFIADKDTIFCKPNKAYVQNELNWYLSQSRNVYDIPGKVPAIWRQVADKDGFIHSNYGWCIFSNENDNQYRNCLRQLLNDPDTRRACMIYNRPSMQYEYNYNGMSDFMCTFSTQQFLRPVEECNEDKDTLYKYKLKYVVYQRSCDAVFGFRNDRAWHEYVAKRLIEDLNVNDMSVDPNPEIIFSCGSIHIYERHFKFIDEYIKMNSDDIGD